jgi:hypothetical protein
MHFATQKLKLLGVGASCLAVGAGASAIATAGAATPASHAAGRSASAAWHAHPGRRRRLLARAVEGQAVVWTKGGWKTVSFERGTVDGVSGRQLTLTEGTPKHAYQQVTVTVPSSARVRNDRRAASLSSLHSGERVIVVNAPRRMFVIAHSS